MPSGSFSLSDNSSFVVPSLSWSTSDNPGANQSTITVVFNAYTTGTVNTFGTFSGGITIDGTRYEISGSRTITTGGSSVVTEIGRASRTVSHSSNGSKSVAISADGGISGTSWTTTSGGGTAVLTTYSVTAPPVFSDASVASSASLGVAYSDGVAASNSPTYSVRNSANTGAGTLPPGLNLNTGTGAITGTPTTVGATSFRIRATNAGGSVTTGILTITVTSAARVWNGTAFVSGLANVWNGTAFVSGIIKVWDGTTWVNAN
jgi:hypothetical protein